MTTTDETTEQGQATGTGNDRTFYATDWQRAAGFLRRARHVQCQPGTAKPLACQAKVDKLAEAIAIGFAADAPGAFSHKRFLASTEPPAQEYEDDES